MTETTASIRVNLAALLGSLKRSIQRSIDLVSLGLMSAEAAATEDMILPGAYLQLAIAGDKRRDLETIKNEFRAWVLEGGLRDCVEAIGSFLEEVRAVCAVWSVAGQSPITGEQWNERIVHESRRFHRLGLPDKIAFLKERYHPALLNDLEDEILTINAARNCLVHRRGIVSGRDANSQEGLQVRWLKMELLAKGPEGEQAIEPPMLVEGPATISVRQAKESKLFRPGDTITFTVQEFSELCWTFFRFGQLLVAQLEEYGRATGIQFGEPDAAAEPESP